MTDVTLRFGARDDGTVSPQFRKMSAGLRDLNTQADAISKGFKQAFSAGAIGLVAGAATSAAAAIGAVVHESIQLADALKKMQDQTGFTVATLQKLQFYASQTGTDVGSLSTGVLKLQKTLGGFEEGSDKAAQTLERLGLANERFRNSNPEEQFQQVAIAISGIADQNERVLRTSELFSKSGGELLPTLLALGRESAQLDEAFTRIGGPIGQDVIDKVDKMGDSMASTAIAAKGLATEVLSIFEPTTTASETGLQTLIGALRFRVEEFRRDLAKVQGNEIPFKNEVDQATQLSFQIDKLTEKLSNPQNFLGLFDTQDSFRAKLRAANAELAELQRRYDVLIGNGPLPKFIKPDVNVPQPADVQFEETDDARRERERREKERYDNQVRLIHEAQINERDMLVEHNELKLKINEEELLKEAAAYSKHLDQKIRVASDAEATMQNIREFFGMQEIQLKELNAQTIAAISLETLGVIALHNSKAAKILKAIALAQAIWDTAAGITRALRDYAWPYNIGVAALVALQGYTQIAKIKSTNFGGSGSAPSVSGGGSVSVPDNLGNSLQETEPTTGRGATTVYMSGFINQEMMDYMVAGLRENFSRDVVIIPTNSLQANIIRQQN